MEARVEDRIVVRVGAGRSVGSGGRHRGSRPGSGALSRPLGRRAREHFRSSAGVARIERRKGAREGLTDRRPRVALPRRRRQRSLLVVGQKLRCVLLPARLLLLLSPSADHRRLHSGSSDTGLGTGCFFDFPAMPILLDRERVATDDPTLQAVGGCAAPLRSSRLSKGVPCMDWSCGQNPGRNPEGVNVRSVRETMESRQTNSRRRASTLARGRTPLLGRPSPAERKRQPVASARRDGGGRRADGGAILGAGGCDATRRPAPPSWTTWQVIGWRSGEPVTTTTRTVWRSEPRARSARPEEPARRATLGILALLLKLRRRHLVAKHPARVCNGRRNGIRLVEDRFKVGCGRIHRSRTVTVFTSQVKTEHNNSLVLALVQHPQCLGGVEPDLSVLADVAGKRSVSVEKIPEREMKLAYAASAET